MTTRTRPRLIATARAADTLHAPVVVLGDPNAARVLVETLPGGVGGWATPGKRLTVDRDLLRDLAPEQTVTVEVPRVVHRATDSLLDGVSIPDLSFEANPPTVGARVWRVGGSTDRTVEEVLADPVITVCESWDGDRRGVALVAWWSPNHFQGPSLRGQAFGAANITTNPHVAVMPYSKLRAHGWPV